MSWGTSEDPEALGSAAAVDFKVKWNTAVPRVPLSYNVLTQEQYDDIICSNNDWSKVIPPF